MNKKRDRLATIFSQVLSLGSTEEALAASMESVPRWDSMAHINLILAVEQEFRIALSPDEAAQAVSFEAMEALVEEKGVSPDSGVGE
jgi:acyl carrier protein